MFFLVDYICIRSRVLCGCLDRCRNGSCPSVHLSVPQSSKLEKALKKKNKIDVIFHRTGATGVPFFSFKKSKVRDWVKVSIVQCIGVHS